MSLIWDLLNHHEKGEARNAVPVNTLDGPRTAATERRRSSRKSIYVPLFVYGYDSAAQPFHQQTHTLEVSANGGLLKLDAKVRRGQKLLLMNRVTNREEECYVVGLTNHANRSHSHVGISFARPAPGFWKSQV